MKLPHLERQEGEREEGDEEQELVEQEQPAGVAVERVVLQNGLAFVT